MNHLYYGDNLKVLRESIRDESVDLVYLDPPFNSNAGYNILFKAPDGNQSSAQVEAFDDTWHWNDSAEEAFGDVMHGANAAASTMLRAMRSFLGDNDMMAYLAMMAVRIVTRSFSRTFYTLDWTLVIFLNLLCMPNSASADSLLGKCENPSYSFDLAVDLFKSTDFNVFQLEQSFGAKVLVFVGLGIPNSAPTANWLITGRAAEDQEYCYLGLGLSVEPLLSPHELEFSEQFGMPGTSLARCSSSQDPLGGIKVRSWAAKELGDSIVLSLSPGDAGEGHFVLLVSKVDTSWILLKQQPTGETCYFDRGPFYKSQSFRWEK